MRVSRGKAIESSKALPDSVPSDEISPYITPSNLAARWQCSRSSVDRIAKRAGLRRLLLGSGKNGLVRYLIKEVVALEKNSIF
jgi:hypothetical protein